MAFQFPRLWDITVNALQIFLSFLILFFYIKNQILKKKIEGKKRIDGTEMSFKASFFNMTIQQQIYQAFTNILTTISIERDELESLFGGHSSNSKEEESPKVRSTSRIDDHEKLRIFDVQEGSPKQHDKIRKFSAKGLNARKIAETLKIPISEVELIMSLEKK
jgi:hypothetical protein